MKPTRRLVKWTTQLYPWWWRSRYGAELDALLDDVDLRWRDVASVLQGAMAMRLTSPEPAARKHREYVLIPLLMAVVAGYTVMALLLLGQWGQPDPWSRLNVFSVSGLLFNALLGAQQFRSYRQLPPSQEVRNEALGYSFDPAMARWISVLGLGELLIYLDYGRWHLVPALEISGLQMTGVALSAVTLALLLWVDAHLVQHFSSTENSRQLMNEGPYRVFGYRVIYQ